MFKLFFCFIEKIPGCYTQDPPEGTMIGGSPFGIFSY